MMRRLNSKIPRNVRKKASVDLSCVKKVSAIKKDVKKKIVLKKKKPTVEKQEIFQQKVAESLDNLTFNKSFSQILSESITFDQIPDPIESVYSESKLSTEPSETDNVKNLPSGLKIKIGKCARSCHLLDLANKKFDNRKEDKIFESKKSIDWITPEDHKIIQLTKSKLFHKKFNRLNELLIINLLQLVGSFLKFLYTTINKLFSSIFSFSSSSAKKMFNNEHHLISSLVGDFQPQTVPVHGGLVKTLAIFVTISALLVAPIKGIIFLKKVEVSKGKILGISTNGISFAKQGAEAFSNFELNGAQENFDKASDYFVSAQQELKKYNSLLLDIYKFIPSGGELRTGESVLKIGENLSEVASFLAVGFNALASNNNDLEQLNLTYKLDALAKQIELALPLTEEANDLLRDLDQRKIPSEYRGQIDLIKENLPFLIQSLDTFLSLSDSLSEILGASEKRRYLLIFQNNTEARPTGGFMGSYALADIYQGNIKNLEVPGGGFYDLKDSFSVRVQPPKPFRIFSPIWRIWEANWFPSWPESAKKIIWFYERSNGPSVDGVLTFTPNVLIELLKITGPIELPEYDKVIDADNFLFEIQKAVEIEYDQEENKPKKIISDLTPIILDKLLNCHNENSIDILTAVLRGIQEKNIMFYFNDSDLQQQVKELGAAGEIKDSEKDFLMVVNTNIAGGKSDKVIQQNIKHQAEIKPDGSIVNTVSIVREHQGEIGELFFGQNNADYVRLYAPKGSRLLSVDGAKPPANSDYKSLSEDVSPDLDLERIEQSPQIHISSGTRITQEFSKTCFANWTQTKPGRSSVITFKYLLPFKIEPEGLLAKSANYSVLFQKQSGTFNQSKIESKIILPSTWQVVWKHGSSEVISKIGQVSFNSVLRTDQYYGIAIED